MTYGAFKTRQGEFLYFLLGMVFMYILPLIVIIVTYGGIVYHLHKKGVTVHRPEGMVCPDEGMMTLGVLGSSE